MDKQIQQKVEQLQIIEQNLQHILLQKQNMQVRLSEVDSAINALNNSKKQSFKIIGDVMIESSSEDLLKDLNSKKEVLEVKVKSYDKQEEKLKTSAKSIQEEVIKTMKKNE